MFRCFRYRVIMRPIRHCLRCGQALPAEFRKDAVFHLSCKNDWMRSRAIAQSSETITAARAFLEPESNYARWYRCAIVISGQRWLYPDPGRATLRFDYWERQSPGFSIKPFEPPIVPVTGQYEILYFDELGNRLNAPVGKALVMLEPLVKIPCDRTGLLMG